MYVIVKWNEGLASAFSRRRGYYFVFWQLNLKSCEEGILLNVRTA